MSNLVSNAVLYTAQDSMVEVRVLGGTAGVTLEVADRGPGVARADRGRIFERFVRLDEARRSYPLGSGLGLAIAEQAAQSHGARIEVEEREGGGAVFRVKLPDHPSPSPPVGLRGSG